MTKLNEGENGSGGPSVMMSVPAPPVVNLPYGGLYTFWRKKNLFENYIKLDEKNKK